MERTQPLLSLRPAKTLEWTDSYGDKLDVDSVRYFLKDTKQKAVTTLIYHALEHASSGITHTDEKIQELYKAVMELGNQGREKLKKDAMAVAGGIWQWMCENKIKTALMFIGLGGTAYKAKTIGNGMQTAAQSFINWGKSTTWYMRFVGFIVLMTIRLVVSTVVPPTSPGFGIILQAATPEDSKWTAMPLFLLASTIAGAAPWILDKILEKVTREDYKFSIAAKEFAAYWPLTCWTEPTMKQIFKSAGGGKLGASLAVIFAHAAPFMGAQTTLMQRYYLPHPLDTILSQPFGMSEDLVSMAVAEATTNPVLGSGSLTAIIVSFNAARWKIFTKGKDTKALVTAGINLVVGLIFIVLISRAEDGSAASQKKSLGLCALLLVISVLVVPLACSGCCKLKSVTSAREPKGGNEEDPESRNVKLLITERGLTDASTRSTSTWQEPDDLVNELENHVWSPNGIAFIEKYGHSDEMGTPRAGDSVTQKHVQQMSRKGKTHVDLEKEVLFYPKEEHHEFKKFEAMPRDEKLKRARTEVGILQDGVRSLQEDIDAIDSTRGRSA